MPPGGESGATARAFSLRRVEDAGYDRATRPTGDSLAERPRDTEPVLPRIAAGDASATADCIDRYGRLVLSLARRFLSSPADAEDAVQEIFMSLWRLAGRFDPARGSELGFVSVLARRRLIDLQRVRARERRGSPAEVEAALEHAPDPAPAADAAAGRIDAKRALEALARLKPEQRRVIELAVLGGLSHPEVADETSLPLGTVKTHSRRGLLRLREILDGEAEDVR